MRTNYVLIDYENVQPSALNVLDQEHIRIRVFTGAYQTKISVTVAAMLQPFGTRVEYIPICGNGSNALDFHIAYYIGQLATAEPDACFHIISKDTGFDPLIHHLRGKKIFVYRWPDVTDMPLVKAAIINPQVEHISTILNNFQQRGASRPHTIATLTRTIHMAFQGRLIDAEVESLVQALQYRGAIQIKGTKVSYPTSG